MEKENLTQKTMVQLNITLHQEEVDWVKSEAEENNMTIDEVIESVITTIRCLTESREAMVSGIIGFMGGADGGDMIN